MSDNGVRQDVCEGTIDPALRTICVVAAPPAICVRRLRLPLLRKRYWNIVQPVVEFPLLNAQSSGRVRYMLIMGNFQNRSPSFCRACGFLRSLVLEKT